MSRDWVANRHVVVVMLPWQRLLKFLTVFEWIFNDSERWSFPSQQKRPLIWLEQRWRCWRVMMGHLAGPSHQSTVNAPSSWGPALQKSSRRGWAPYVRHSSLLKSTAPMHVLCNNKTISFFFHHRDCIVFYTVLFYFLLEMTKKNALLMYSPPLVKDTHSYNHFIKLF